MFVLSAASERELGQLSPGPTGFAWRARLFLLILGWLGWEVLVTDGRRTIAQQNHFHALNPANPAYVPGRLASHVDGNAIDINAQRAGVVLRQSTPRAVWLAASLPLIASLLGIGWGGDFVNYGPNGDAVHFFKK